MSRSGQVPSLLRSRLDDCLDGPDRSVTLQAIHDELTRSLNLAPGSASQTLQAVFRVMSGSVSAGQIAEVRGQLPQEMKALLPTSP